MDCKIGAEKRTKFSDYSNLLHSLTEGLLFEILIRLPSKSVIQFKSVCKLWYSLISSPDFIRFFNHRRHDRSLPPIHDSDSLPYSIMFQIPHKDPNVGYINSLQFHCRYTEEGVAEFYGRHSFDLSFLPFPPHQIELNASCNGLVLCSFKKARMSRTTYFYVCNLQTKQWVPLPLARNFLGHTAGLLCVPAPCSLCHGEGYGGVDHTDYKFTVVQFPKGYHMRVHSQFKVQLFSSEECRWRTIVLSSPPGLRFKLDYDSDVVAYRGMLHWLKYPYILVFDPYNAPGRFSRVIELAVSPRCDFVLGFGVCQDRLWVTCKDRGSPYSIWKLKDYDMGEWSLEHQVFISNIHFPESFIRARYLYPDGNALCWMHDHSVRLCNLQSGVIEYEFHHRCLDLDIDEGNFLKIDDLWWPTPVPSLPLKIQSSA